MVGTIQSLKRGLGRVGMMAGVLFLAGGWPVVASAACLTIAATARYWLCCRRH